MKALTTGDIVEVYLKKIRRFIYVKYIDIRQISEHVNYPFQFRVNQGFFEHALQSVTDLDFSDLLFSPLHLTGFNALIKSGEWKIVGKQKINEFDKKQHHYKTEWPPSFLTTIEEVKQWRVFKDLNKVNEFIFVEYNRCAHLEYAENLGAAHLDMRVIIEFFKKSNKEPKFDRSNWDKFDEVLFGRYVSMPVYAQVPDSLKGRLLPENYNEPLFWLNIKGSKKI